MKNQRLKRAMVALLIILLGVAALLVGQPSMMTVASAAPACRPANGLPDKACTPGAIDPRVKQNNIYTTICRSGYTSKVRPPVSYTNALKISQIAAWGLPGTKLNYEEDHLIPLSIGGAPRDPRNLWPEPWKGSLNAVEKDDVEFKVYRAVCDRKVTLAQAQAAFADNWMTAMKVLKLS